MFLSNNIKAFILISLIGSPFRRIKVELKVKVKSY